MAYFSIITVFLCFCFACSSPSNRYYWAQIDLRSWRALKPKSSSSIGITIWDVKRKSPGSGCYVSPKSLIRSRDLSGAVSDFEGSTSRRSTCSFHAVDVPVADLFCHDFVLTYNNIHNAVAFHVEVISGHEWHWKYYGRELRRIWMVAWGGWDTKPWVPLLPSGATHIYSPL